MKRDAILKVKNDTFNFLDFDKIIETVTLTFAGNRITIQPGCSNNTERKFSFLLNCKKEITDRYLAEYLRNECDIQDKCFDLIFKYLPSPIRNDIYYYNVTPFKDYSFEELSEIYKDLLE